MTALKPIENRRVRAVASERYPLNRKCAHPECAEDADDPHHIFPRSLIAGDSWFVAILESDEVYPSLSRAKDALPHVTGLCRAHHDDVEEHRAWIKLEDGVFVWYDLKPADERTVRKENDYSLLGPLNPQPGSVEGKPKRKRFKGEKRRQRRTISLRVPDEAAEDGGGIWDDRIDMVKERMEREGLDPDRPPYYLLTEVMYDWATGG